MTANEDVAARSPIRADRTGMFALWGANGISALGSAMTNVAVPWFILQTTGSAARTGLVATAMTLGAVLSGVLSGPLIDRFGFKRSSVLTDVASAVLIAGIPLLYAAGALPFWLILVLVFVITCMQGPGDAARYALVPGLAHRAGTTIERANGVDRTIAKATLLVGPIVGGVLIAALGPENVLYVDAVTFAASAVLIALFVHPRSHEEGAAAVAQIGRRYRADLLVGLRFVFSNGLLLSIVTVVAVANALDGSLVTVVLPVYARDIWGSPTAFGALTSAIGAGALIGAAVFGLIGHRMPRRLVFLVAGAGGALLLYGGLALTPPLGVMLLLALLGAVVAGPIVPLIFTVVQTITPADVYGRVFGALQSLSASLAPIVIAIVGFVIEGAGLVPTIVTLGAIYLVVTLGMLFNPALRRLDMDRASPLPEQTGSPATAPAPAPDRTEPVA
ncbi:MFS transporter [Geodermatophilus sp. URMC 62]|uniref:MFS transporter n=1 Tax=Geodermatophilus sp. URMC 62 TaxID=3423414 RepID=UPI00406CAAE2